VLIQPDPKIKQRRASEVQAGDGFGICDVLMKEHKELKRKQREKRMYQASKARMDRANEKASVQVLNENSGKILAKTGKPGYGQLQEVGFPTEYERGSGLRRLKSFGNLTESNANIKAKAEGDRNLVRMHSHRQAIREGKLEKVVPPSSPRKPKLIPESQDALQSKTVHKKSASTSSKLTSYMETSADLLDATRRDLTSNLRKSAEKAEKALSSKFDQFGRYSWGHGNDWDDDSDSDESFYCIGERHLSKLDKARRISGDGTDPWTDAPPQECRLCRKPSPSGVRSLCRDCENEFRRPKTTVLVDDEDEVKPPPPLKIKKAKTFSKHTYAVAENTHDPFSDNNFPTSNLARVDKKPQIVIQSNHISQQVYIDDGYQSGESEAECVSSYECWQPPDLRVQYQSQENENSRWSPRLLNDGEMSTPQPSLRSRFSDARRNSMVRGDATPTVAEDNINEDERSSKGRKKHESYYEYWEEILREDACKVASLAKPDDRYPRLR